MEKGFGERTFPQKGFAPINTHKLSQAGELMQGLRSVSRAANCIVRFESTGSLIVALLILLVLVVIITAAVEFIFVAEERRINGV